MVQEQLGHSIKIFQSDGGGECDNFSHAASIPTNKNSLLKILSWHSGLKWCNRIECKHRHLLEMVCGLLIQTLLPSKFWVDATYTTIFTINWLPFPLLGPESPFQKLFRKSLDYTFLHTFGCDCFPTFPASSQNKLQPCSAKCVLLGYATQYKGYRCLEVPTGKVFTSQNVQFHEHISLLYVKT